MKRVSAKTEPETKTSREVSLITGASLRQLQWLDEHDFVSPKRGDMGRRQYTEAEIELICNLMRLPRFGLRKRIVLIKTLFKTGKTVDECVEWYSMLKPFLTSGPGLRNGKGRP